MSTVVAVDETGFMDHALERSRYRASEMPQAFRFADILQAYKQVDNFYFFSLFFFFFIIFFLVYIYIYIYIWYIYILVYIYIFFFLNFACAMSHQYKQINQLQAYKQVFIYS